MANIYKAVSFANSGGGGSVTKYTEDLFAASSWGSAISGYYLYTILATNHGQGLNPIIKVYQLILGEYELVDTSVSITSSGNITLRISSTPDLRFDGKLVII